MSCVDATTDAPEPSSVARMMKPEPHRGAPAALMSVVGSVTLHVSASVMGNGKGACGKEGLQPLRGTEAPPPSSVNDTAAGVPDGHVCCTVTATDSVAPAFNARAPTAPGSESVRVGSSKTTPTAPAPVKRRDLGFGGSLPLPPVATQAAYAAETFVNARRSARREPQLLTMPLLSSATRRTTAVPGGGVMIDCGIRMPERLNVSVSVCDGDRGVLTPSG